MEINIRRTTRNDADKALDLLSRLSTMERGFPLPSDVCARLIEDCWGTHPYFETLLIETNSNPIGVCLTYDIYSTYLAEPVLFIEALFIDESYRGLGIGSKFFNFLIEDARKRGYRRLDWTSPNENVRAHNFYKKNGGHKVDEALLNCFYTRVSTSSTDVSKTIVILGYLGY